MPSETPNGKFINIPGLVHRQSTPQTALGANTKASHLRLGIKSLDCWQGISSRCLLLFCHCEAFHSWNAQNARLLEWCVNFIHLCFFITKVAFTSKDRRCEHMKWIGIYVVFKVSRNGALFLHTFLQWCINTNSNFFCVKIVSFLLSYHMICSLHCCFAACPSLEDVVAEEGM